MTHGDYRRTGTARDLLDASDLIVQRWVAWRDHLDSEGRAALLVGVRDGVLDQDKVDAALGELNRALGAAEDELQLLVALVGDSSGAVLDEG